MGLEKELDANQQLKGRNTVQPHDLPDLRTPTIVLGRNRVFSDFAPWHSTRVGIFHTSRRKTSGCD